MNKLTDAEVLEWLENLRAELGSLGLSRDKTSTYLPKLDRAIELVKEATREPDSFHYEVHCGNYAPDFVSCDDFKTTDELFARVAETTEEGDVSTVLKVSIRESREVIYKCGQA